MSKLRLRECNLLSVSGPEIQMKIMDRKVLCKLRHKKTRYCYKIPRIPWKDVPPQMA